MTDKLNTYFVTKWALTQGILKLHLRDSHTPSMKCSDFCGFFHGEGKEWHRDAASAVAHANKMRLAKIASLKKSIAKLEAKTFTEADIKEP